MNLRSPESVIDIPREEALRELFGLMNAAGTVELRLLLLQARRLVAVGQADYGEMRFPDPRNGLSEFLEEAADGQVYLMLQMMQLLHESRHVSAEAAE